MAFSTPSSSTITISKTFFGMCLVAMLACSSAESLGHDLKRSDFPSDFFFGASTSALQIEGSIRKDGRGLSIWDHFTMQHPEKITGRTNTSIAIDSYNRWREDLKDLKALGVGAHRFSISWSRILPDGTLKGGVNEKGIDHYNQFIDALIAYDIKPIATLLHFDVPQSIQETTGGFLNNSIANAFGDYAELCFRTFGDRVKTWITVNEPVVVAKFGFDKGEAAPGRCTNRTICAAGNSATEPYIVGHNFLLAHAAAVKIYREKFQKNQGGEIGLSLATTYFEPYSESQGDIAAQERAMEFDLGWYMQPLVYGEYPSIMRKIVRDRLPTFTDDQKELVKGSFDFLGINYYTARFIESRPINFNASPVSYLSDIFVDGYEYNKNRSTVLPMVSGSYFIYSYPQGLQKMLEYIKDRYQSPKIYITENGATEWGYETIFNDTKRIDYIAEHLYYVSKAIKNGVNVKGYSYWSAFDSFELQSGFTSRFGLYYVDWQTLQRTPKMSAKWYHDFITGSNSSIS